MLYTLIGRAVVKAAKLFLRRKYGRTYLPKPLVAGGLVAVMLAVLLVLLRRDDDAQ
jgi:Na+/glutamate symporter